MAGVMGLEEKAQAAPHCFAVLGAADHSVQGANSFIHSFHKCLLSKAWIGPLRGQRDHSQANGQV